MPAYRICVNQGTLFGAMGYTAGWDPSFTLGTGTIGGAISSDNIGPQHLINRKRVGMPVRDWREGGVIRGARRRRGSAPRPTPPPPSRPSPHRRLNGVLASGCRPSPRPPSSVAAAAAAARVPVRQPTSLPLDLDAVVRDAIEEVLARG